jgi:hypothetical protein
MLPRWWTEGLEVNEETEAPPEWSDPFTPDMLEYAA